MSVILNKKTTCSEANLVCIIWLKDGYITYIEFVHVSVPGITEFMCYFLILEFTKDTELIENTHTNTNAPHKIY